MTRPVETSIIDNEQSGRVLAPSHTTPDVSQLLANRRVNLDRCLLDLDQQSATIAALCDQIVATLKAGQKLLMAGNGGSAAEAQHIVAELVGRFQRERAPYAALALTTDTSILTAVANDYGFDDVFARQVHALGNPGDMLVVISTSGTSENLIRAAGAARLRGMYTVALTGMNHNPLIELADCPIQVPDDQTASVQEIQGILLHVLCEIVEAELAINVDAGANG